MEQLNRLPKKSRRRGMALIVVLGCLIFLSALALAFLAGVGTELKSSKLYADGTTVRLMAESCVNLVMGQIKTATSGRDESGNDLAWASQPGMIRTYDGQGNLHKAYKLYSSGEWVISGVVDAGAEANERMDWKSKPAHFTDLNASSSGIYPILDPAAEGVVEGFSFASSLPSGVAKGEMPVQWLYILKNGEIVPPEKAVSATHTAVVAAATAGNPIVGRIAFWTDDETGKVNINTASGGTFWDTSRVTSEYDRNMAINLPVKNEFQRYPGHPAMTSLQVALPSISGLGMAYALSPRLVDGGSKGGTVSSASPINLKRDRLYSSVDELMFNPLRGTQGIAKGDLSRSRFFVTASSRAPEVNLFNEPRVALWPLSKNGGAAYRSPQDDLIAFCSTINGKPYYFQRDDPGSQSADYDSIERNRSLFAYLQRLTGSAIPGFGGKFSTKYAADRDQILTEIFDYIRCVNLNDQAVTAPYAPKGQVIPIRVATPTGENRGFGRFPLVHEIAIVFAGIGEGKNTLSTPNVAATKVAAGQVPFYAGIDSKGTPPDNTRAIQAFIVISFLNPAQGWCAYTPDFTVEIDGLDQFELNHVKMGFPSSGTTLVNYPSTLAIFQQQKWGGLLDFRSFVYQKEFSSAGNNRFPFYSRIIEVPATTPATPMAFKGGPVTVKIYDGSSANLLQTLHVDFPPAGDFTPPSLSSSLYRLIGVSGLQSRTGAQPFDRFDNVDNGGYYDFFGSAPKLDTVQSMILADGDDRLNVLSDVSAGRFSPHQNWGNNQFAHSLETNVGYPFKGATFGRLVANASYAYYPPLSPGLNGVFVNGDPLLPQGDFDNGIAASFDGPYINKPDEGNNAYVNGTGQTPYNENTYTATPAAYFTPNRQMPSAGMLGSLPTGVQAGLPWRTLLFRPDPAGNHPGGGSPADHLIMDLFWMPVVEPFAISEPFSTAGKINMNYQIMPFTFISRETGVRAVLKSERILAIQPSDAGKYKSNFGTFPADYRYDLDLNETLKGFQQRFGGNDIFRSATEIANIYLVPTGKTYSEMPAFWAARTLVGDNSRERPYANIYPRLTTKSNTFTIHYRVQLLQKQKGASQQDRWIEGPDRILAEYRGSTLLERYIDPNNSLLPDYATDAGAAPLDTYYKFRVITSKQFNP